MYRTLVILRHTFFEAIAQPIYSLLIGLGAAIILIFAMLPFFTLGEDTTMYQSVGLDMVLLLALLATLFATSRSIYEEIEDRTMLTLMSKPVSRWQVLIGKYLGLCGSAGLGVAIMGVILGFCIWLRIPGDYMINQNSLSSGDVQRLHDLRIGHLAGIPAALILIWLQISVLAAISVAISTRVALVVNLPIVILLYIAGNLTRFIFPTSAPGSPLFESSAIVKGFAYFISLLLPYLETFDLQQLTVYRPIAITQMAARDINSVRPSVIYGYLIPAFAYAACYAAFALSLGMALFRSRELGGGDS